MAGSHAALVQQLKAMFSKKSLLAFRNLLRSPTRLFVTIAGIVFATFLMAVQGSLLFGFTMAASRIVDAVDADIWLVAKGTPAFDFISPIPVRYADIALSLPGVAATGHAAGGWLPFERPDGDRTFVYLVGVETEYRGRLPDITAIATERGRAEATVVIDRTDIEALSIPAIGAHVQIAGQRAFVEDITSTLSSFLGTPYVFATYRDARQYLRLDTTRSTAILLRVQPGYDPRLVRKAIESRLPEVDVWTKADFANRSRIFWLIKTGAGGALSLAAILGFMIGLVVVSQTIYALTSENIEEFATLKAMGAADADIRGIVITQSLACGVVGGGVGLLLVEPFASFAQTIIAWISVPYWMYACVGVLLLVLCVLAAVIAARPALSVEPGRVFRA